MLELLGFLRRHFHTAQHDLRNGIQAAHEHRPTPFARAIQMQNVTSLGAHGRFESWRGLPMSQRQVNNELFPQIAYFPGAEANVLGGQLFDNFVTVAGSLNGKRYGKQRINFMAGSEDSTTISFC